jgi:hypothetical protein
MKYFLLSLFNFYFIYYNFFCDYDCFKNPQHKILHLTNNKIIPSKTQPKRIIQTSNILNNNIGKQQYTNLFVLC